MGKRVIVRWRVWGRGACFYKVAKGHSGRGGGKRLQFPGPRSVLRQATQFLGEYTWKWMMSKPSRLRENTRARTYTPRQISPLAHSVWIQTSDSDAKAKCQPPHPPLKWCNLCFPSPAHGDLSSQRGACEIPAPSVRSRHSPGACCLVFQSNPRPWPKVFNLILKYAHSTT